MKWKTPVFDEALCLYRICTNERHRILDDGEREWLLEKNIQYYYALSSDALNGYFPVTTQRISIISFILLPKKLAVEFTLKFGGKV